MRIARSIIDSLRHKTKASYTPTSNDTTAPATPGSAPTLVSGGTAVLETVVSVPVGADSTVNNPPQTVSGLGTGAYRLFLGASAGSTGAPVTRSQPSVGTGALTLVYPAGGTAPAGSSNSTTFTVTTSGLIWNASDNAPMFLAPSTGDVVLDTTVTSITASGPWCRYLLMIRKSTAHDSACVAIEFVTSNTLTITTPLGASLRSADGTVMVNVGTFIAASLPIRLRILRQHLVYLLQYATNVTTPSWVTFATVTADLGESLQIGEAGEGAQTVTRTKNSVAAATSVYYSFTGTASTTKYVDYELRDLASPPNTSGRSSALSITYSGAGTGTFAPAYPRLGGYHNSYDASINGSTVRAYLSKLDVDILVQYDGSTAMLGGGSNTWNTFLTAVRAVSPLAEQKFIGYCDHQFFYAASDTGSEAYRTAAGTGNWRARDSYPSGSYVGFLGSGTNLHVNTSASSTALGAVVAADKITVSGTQYTAQEWWVKWITEVQYLGMSNFALYTNEANPLLNGTFLDDLYAVQPNSSGTTDYDRNGSTDTNTSGQEAAWVNGQKEIITAFRTVNPTKLLMANVANVYDATLRTKMKAAYDQLFDGGVSENLIGNALTFEAEAVGGHAEMLLRANFQEDLLKGSKILIISHNGVNNDGSDDIDGTAYRAMRFGLLWTLVFTDGYYYPNNGSGAADYLASNNVNMVYLDEFFGGSLNNRKYLGAAISTRQTAAWSANIHRRDFAGGIALVNVSGSTQTRPAIPGYKYLTGSQDSSLNSGASANATLSMPTRTGHILIPV